MDFETKLAQYRAQKRRSAYINSVKETLQSFFGLHHRKIVEETNPMTTEDEVISVTEPLLNVDECASETSSDLNEGSCYDSRSLNYIDIFTYLLYAVFWLTLFILFLKLEFGIIFLIVSCLIGMYLNTRTGPKRRGEVSAYSVFNKNCESIDGTLKAEQFEREIRFGANSIH